MIEPGEGWEFHMYFVNWYEAWYFKYQLRIFLDITCSWFHCTCNSFVLNRFLDHSWCWFDCVMSIHKLISGSLFEYFLTFFSSKFVKWFQLLDTNISIYRHSFNFSGTTRVEVVLHAELVISCKRSDINLKSKLYSLEARDTRLPSQRAESANVQVVSACQQKLFVWTTIISIVGDFEYILLRLVLK